MFKAVCRPSRRSGASSPGKIARISRSRCTPSPRPNKPSATFTITGTPQLAHPESVYKGMETSDATTRPIRRPTVPEIKADPGNEWMYAALMRQGLRIRYGTRIPPMITPPRAIERPQGTNCSVLDDSSDIYNPSRQPVTPRPPAHNALNVQRANN